MKTRDDKRDAAHGARELIDLSKRSCYDARSLLKPFNPNPGPPQGGSTDVADVSWNIPTIHLSVTTAPLGAPWHGWPVVSCGGMSIGHKGMIHASKALAATMIDLYRDPKLLQGMKSEFAKQTEGIIYKPYIPAGPPPIP